ncbi:UNVERIFIED_CONTAM: HNH endonuclease [Comamonas sp. A-3]
MLTAARLKELLVYDPAIGEFRWLQSRGKAKKGSVAGSGTPNGYTVIRIDPRNYYAHRLAFLYMDAEWPQCEVDHVNGARTDNRWVNLRDVDVATNVQNKHVPHRNNKLGLLGVSWHAAKRKYRAGIDTFGKKIHLGYFSDPNAAHQAYLSAKRAMHPGCTI